MKKKSPRERPATQADVNRAKRDAAATAIKRCLRMVAYVLLDKRGESVDSVQDLIDCVENLSAHINAGRISWSFVDKVLSEYGVIFKMSEKNS